MDEETKPTAAPGAAAARAEKIFNRQQLVAKVAEKTGLPHAKALAAVEAVFESAGTALKDGKELRVVGFGTFMVSERKAGKGRDPRTGAEIDIPEGKSVRFRPGKVLRDLVADKAV